MAHFGRNTVLDYYNRLVEQRIERIKSLNVAVEPLIFLRSTFNVERSTLALLRVPRGYYGIKINQYMIPRRDSAQLKLGDSKYLAKYKKPRYKSDEDD